MDMSKKTAGETRAPAAIRSFLRGLRILSRFALRMTGRLVIAKVRVSGGHLCKAEAPTEPAGETQSDCGNPFPLSKSYKQKKTA